MWSPRRGLLLLLLLLPTVAYAQRQPPGLSYSAPSSCPNGASFREQTERRSALAKLLDAPTVQPFVVTISQQRQGFVGSLERAGHEPRVVSDESCDDVAEALALMLALALEQAPELSASRAAATKIEAPRPLPPAQPRSVQSVSAAPEHSSESRFSLGIWGRAERTAGLADDTLTWWGGGLGLETLWNARTWLAPGARVGLLGAGSRGAANSRLRLVAARFEVATLRLVLGPFSLAPVLGFEAGGLHARSGLSEEAGAPPARTRAWLALTQAVHLELTLPKRLYLSLICQLREPLRHYRFVLSSSSMRLRVATVQGLELSFAFGAGVRF